MSMHKTYCIFIVNDIMNNYKLHISHGTSYLFLHKKANVYILNIETNNKVDYYSQLIKGNIHAVIEYIIQ